MKNSVRNPSSTWFTGGNPLMARISPATRKNPAPKCKIHPVEISTCTNFRPDA
ncbi:MAG: hypothetical protein M0Q91_14780 [Methanoregula sp.]|nr:hypothetical protein [Methanoregula sp.]